MNELSLWQPTTIWLESDVFGLYFHRLCTSASWLVQLQCLGNLADRTAPCWTFRWTEGIFFSVTIWWLKVDDILWLLEAGLSCVRRWYKCHFGECDQGTGQQNMCIRHTCGWCHCISIINITMACIEFILPQCRNQLVEWIIILSSLLFCLS